MKAKTILIICFIFLILLGGGTCAYNCNKQHIARNWGGSMTVDLEPGEKLETVTWKEDELWYQTRPMRPDEQPEEHTFHQKKAGTGRWDGKVVLKEFPRR